DRERLFVSPRHVGVDGRGEPLSGGCELCARRGLRGFSPVAQARGAGLATAAASAFGSPRPRFGNGGARTSPPSPPSRERPLFILRPCPRAGSRASRWRADELAVGLDSHRGGRPAALLRRAGRSHIRFS